MSSVPRRAGGVTFPLVKRVTGVLVQGGVRGCGRFEPPAELLAELYQRLYHVTFERIKTRVRIGLK
jgi:hypothetical protein